MLNPKKYSFLGVFFVVTSLTGAASFADHRVEEQARESVALADGGRLITFKDGKMAKQDRFGQATRMKVGEAIQTKDGKSVVVTSDEVARLSLLSRDGHGN